MYIAVIASYNDPAFVLQSTLRFGYDLLPGRLGLAKACLSSCFGRNSSSTTDPVISDGLEASSLLKVRLTLEYEDGWKYLFGNLKTNLILNGIEKHRFGSGVHHAFLDLGSWWARVNEDYWRRLRTAVCIGEFEEGITRLRVRDVRG